MRVARVLAQAKVNLFLKVFGRDASGYHPIATLFQRLDLADEIVLRVGGRVRTLDATGPQLPAKGLGPAEKNLAFRAAIEYAARTGWEWPKGFSIELTKNIPVGGGLGGGSADAGAVLRALDALGPKPLDPDQRDDLARSLGSDVPFLASEYVMAYAVGRGETLSAPPHPWMPPPADVLLVVPPFGISTADAYRWLDEEGPPRESPSHPTDGPVALQPVSSAWQGLGLFEGGNDFEPVVERRHPELREYRERLGSLGATIAHLSGSGSCVFGIFEGALPDPGDLAFDAAVIPTRTSSRVVQVEVLK